MEYSFDVSEATKFGVEEAIILKNLKFWILKNKANKKHFYDGRTWTYNSYEAFSELFEFWTPKQIRRILKSLIDQKVVITGNYNKLNYDKTLWYAFFNEGETLCPNGQKDLPKRAKGSAQTGKPIPDNKPDNKPDNIYIDQFNKIWDLYQYKVGKIKALTAFKKVKPKDYAAILEHIPKYVESTPDKNFRKHLATYLNGEHWNDEIIKFKSNSFYDEPEEHGKIDRSLLE